MGSLIFVNEVIYTCIEMNWLDIQFSIDIRNGRQLAIICLLVYTTVVLLL